MMNINTVQTKKRINIELPQTIITRLDGLARQFKSDRSKLIRRFISEKLAEAEKEQFELAMKKGYQANYDFIKTSNSDWDFTLKD